MQRQVGNSNPRSEGTITWCRPTLSTPEGVFRSKTAMKLSAKHECRKGITMSRNESTFITRGDPRSTPIERAIVNELVAEIEKYPYKNNAFKFYLYFQNHKDEILERVSKSFAKRYPKITIIPIEVGNKDYKMDKVLWKTGWLPDLVFRDIQKKILKERLKSLEGITKEIKNIKKILDKNGEKFKPSKVQQVCTPRKKEIKYIHVDYYYDQPQIRVALKKIKEIRQEIGMDVHRSLFI